MIMATIKVQNMNCGKCVERIKNALKEANIECDVCLESKTVTVADELKNAAVNELDDIGFIVL